MSVFFTTKLFVLVLVNENNTAGCLPRQSVYAVAPAMRDDAAARRTTDRLFAAIEGCTYKTLIM